MILVNFPYYLKHKYWVMSDHPNQNDFLASLIRAIEMLYLMNAFYWFDYCFPE